MSTIDTLTHFLTQAGTEFQLFDLGRQLRPLERARFERIERQEEPYPWPLQQKAWLAVHFHQEAGKHYLWFLSFPLDERGLLESTMVVMAGEMGRTPRLSTLGKFYQTAGRDHWGTQSVFFAGGGVQGGRAFGATDKIGAYPVADDQTPENLGATIYHGLGLPRETAWHDPSGRPHFVYHAEPIAGLF